MVLYGLIHGLIYHGWKYHGLIWEKAQKELKLSPERSTKSIYQDFSKLVAFL